MLAAIKRFFLGEPINPFHPNVRRHLSLVVLLAWVGLGADPLSSSCYGPEQAYLALEGHHHLALYIAAIMVVTIFIISLGYNQVMELFPSGGGGYKVASKLLHPYIGLVSGAALIVDYVLTIAISIASGADSVFSFLPIVWSAYKLYIEVFLIILLLILNLRGMKEAIQILLPIVLGFIITHVGLIIYGVIGHSEGLLTVVPDTFSQTHQLAQTMGWVSVIGFVLHAYSLGGGTYTGLEAVSNNVQRLAEPRAQTGKKTMFYMALSLSFT
ncbi:MAG: APC family permease, partial [Gammaproteobacteria bacterium]|nr:APC family permease [Gammaproteobacteria bacterium]